MQFLFLGMGQSFISGNAILMAFSWSILMSLNIVFSNFWGNRSQGVERQSGQNDRGAVLRPAAADLLGFLPVAVLT